MNTPNRPGEPGPWSRRRPGLRLPLPLPPPLPSATSVVADIIAKNPPSSPAIADLVRIERIGNGSGGTVWKVQHRVTGKIYALKHVHGHHDDDDVVLRNIRRELDILRNTDDPYVVHCHGLYNDDGEIQILLEYMDGGSLEGRHIADEAQLAEVARQVLDGLAYLHRRRVVHRDMKPANLLINSAGKVKIADFGVSRILSRTIDPCMSSVGTVAYMSPERISAGLNDGTYDGFAGDVWSFGLSILELYLGYFPFRDQLDNTGNWTRLMMTIVNGAPPEAPASASPEFRDFISCCLKKEPGRRVKPANLVRHRFLTRMPQ